jgi:hypothetical protein
MTLIDVLLRIYLYPSKVSSNFSREQAQEIAALASLGMITTREGRQDFGRSWRITADGYELLKEECVI